MDWLWFILAGALAGWLAGRVMRGNGFGLPGDVVVGIAGAFIGGWLFPAVGEEIVRGTVGRLLAAFAGALLLLFVVRLFTGRRAGRRLWS
jgi:uncharacterized membrane protein YeaQ/YmgE (transglycosylase-associated protein family)